MALPSPKQGQGHDRLPTPKLFRQGQYNVVPRIISETPPSPHAPRLWDGGKWCSGLPTYTCRWVRSRSSVTSFLTSSKRRRLVGTMFSKIDRESCWTDASTAFVLT